MNRGINIILLMLFVLTMSCTNETLIQVDGQSDANVELRFEAFNTRDAANPEEAVKSVRVLIFGTLSSQDKGKLLCNKLAVPDNGGRIAPVIISNGVRDIYLIVNEPNVDKSTYDNIATVADVEALTLAYVGTNSTSPYRPDIPMFIRHLNRNVYASNKNETNSNIERMMAKVTLNLNVKNTNFPAGKYPIIDAITIKNLPKYSYYIAKPYAGDLIPSEVQTPTVATPTATGYNYSSTNTFYVPEYILSKITDGAYFEITGHANGEVTTKKIKWTVKVGDAMDDTKKHGDRYDITRNRHYTFIGDVKSYGEHDVDIQTNVSVWNNVRLTGEDGMYIALSPSSTLPTAGSQIAYNTCFYTVTCDTNIGGWYVVVKDAKGNIVGGSVSTEGSKTPIITDGTPQTQTLNVIIQPNNEDADRKVTLEMKHDFYSSKNFSEKREYTQKFMKLVLVSDRITDYTADPVNPPQIPSDRLSGILGGWDGTSFCYLLYKYGSVVGVRSYFETYSPQEVADPFGIEDIAWEPANKTYSRIVRWVDPNNPRTYSPGDVPCQTGDYAHTQGSVENGLGDPCRLVGLTPEQIRNGKIDNRTWKTPDTFSAGTKTRDFESGTRMAGLVFDNVLFLQGSGSRHYVTGGNSNRGTDGFYRFTQVYVPKSGEPAEYQYYTNNFDVHVVYHIYDVNYSGVVPHERGDAFSIRCVRQ